MSLLLLKRLLWSSKRDENQACTLSPHNDPNWTEPLKKIGVWKGKADIWDFSLMISVGLTSLRTLYLLIFSFYKVVLGCHICWESLLLQGPQIPPISNVLLLLSTDNFFQFFWTDHWQTSTSKSLKKSQKMNIKWRNLSQDNTPDRENRFHC